MGLDRDFMRMDLDPPPVEKQDVAVHDRKIIWIITEQDRSATTVLFPEEY